MSAKVGIWMPLYIGDYLSDTMHLTTEQHGAYLLLIMAYWKNGGELQGAGIQAITRMSSDAWSNAQAMLESMFSIQESGNWKHQRIDRELAEAGLKKGKATAKALAGANARWGDKNANASSMLQALLEDMPKQCPSPSPSLLESKALVIDESNDVKPSKKKDGTPYEQIKNLYAEHLPGFPQPQALSHKRKLHIKAIWDSEKCAQNIDFFGRFFGYVNKSDFIRGMGVGIDWIINPANYLKIIEGNYENKS